MRYVAHRVFDRQMRKLPQSLRSKVRERLAVLASGENAALLNDHKLEVPFAGFRSINITGDYRLVYQRIGTDTYFLRAIGTHHQLYGT